MYRCPWLLYLRHYRCTVIAASYGLQSFSKVCLLSCIYVAVVEIIFSYSIYILSLGFA